MFHKEILSEEQIQILPLVKHFRRNFYLVGGTGIALYLGHRKSIDFDLFTLKYPDFSRIKTDIAKLTPLKHKFIFEKDDQLHLLIGSVKFTFFNFRYKVPHKTDFQKIITMPSLLDLGAMKAFAFAQRAKWKDYVDMYFILKHHSFKEIVTRTEELFNTEESIIFSEKLFRQHLCYYDNVKNEEPVEYLIDEISEEEIKSFLIKIAVTPA